MFAVIKVQGGKENEERVRDMLTGIETPVEGELTVFLILPWFTEFTELPRDVIQQAVDSMTQYLVGAV